ncbi:uncharacterized protein GIQ15_05438 [Arthroderma uncinatum]|uniref:uncharacterized protein n=1 Tax=Arthroderma uncinatum TaxID=74035 RepID=UPI00144A6A6D|nr:uncharacterized protein GIQ15_05438 [Arthroderma uncinatum]KAF3480091.1 hypothetical protein GIQ15_05438 [Arthroderma uncinatum]
MEGSHSVTVNVLGTLGTVLWCIQLVPQIWLNWRRKKTEGLPAAMMFLWALCGVPFGIYMILQEVNIPLQVQPQVFTLLCLISWAQTLYYNSKYSKTMAVAIATVSGALMGGTEVLFILALRVPYRQGTTWPALVFGIIAGILLVLGLVPAYLELWKRDGRVIGISWIFLSIDSLGALFSLLALAAEGTFDVLGGVLYITLLVLELGIMTSHIIWRARNRNLLGEARSKGLSVDELLDGRRPARPARPASDEEDGHIPAKSQS